MKSLLVTVCFLFSFMKSYEAVATIEGDIAINAALINRITGNTAAYNGIVKDHWTGGVLPYVFEPGFSSEKKNLVYEAIAEYKKYTCVKIVPRTNEKDYAIFVNDGGCYSYVGVTGGKQNISIGDGCHTKGIVIHEIMHAIGFYHEQSRLDRDQYIKINFQNIYAGTTFNFQKYSHGDAKYWGEKYDLKSIMQYGNYAFSKNAKKTIEVISDRFRIIGQRDGFSQSDVKKINNMYKCGSSRPTPKAITIAICKDLRKECPVWEKKGHCISNRGYMVRGCPVSCGLCPSTNTVSPVTAAPRTQVPKTTITMITTPQGSCKDRYNSCQSMVSQGLCSSSPKYMKTWCMKSCSFCSTTYCVDSNASCSLWAKSGHCNINPVYMYKNCQKSCSIC